MDGIINFDEIKNKAKDKDVDKLEQYIYSLYYSLAQGEITMGDLSKSISEYMEQYFSRKVFKYSAKAYGKIWSEF